MFKVAKRYVTENGDMPILEDYGFEKNGYLNYSLVTKENVLYMIYFDTRGLSIYKSKDKMDDLPTYYNYQGLHLLYTLIKDNIIEWED